MRCKTIIILVHYISYFACKKEQKYRRNESNCGSVIHHVKRCLPEIPADTFKINIQSIIVLLIPK